LSGSIRVAAIGLGWVALHRHLPVIDRSTALQVVGVIDRRIGVARSVAAKRSYKFYAETGDLRQVPWLDQVDAVTVATSPMSHYEIINDALALGKHVLTEKPFVMSVDEGERLVRLAEAAGRRLAIVHNFQFARSTNRLVADLAANRLGEITAVSAIQFSNPRRRLPVWYDSLPLGLFYDESPHLLYMLRRIAGRLRLARAFVVPSGCGLATPARIDAYFAADETASPVTLHCNFEAPVSEWYVVVCGKLQIGVVDLFRDIYIRLPNDGNHTTATVVHTSAAATLQHWGQALLRALPHLRGTMFYGNEKVFDRFARAIGGDEASLAPIGPASALDVLALQHEIIDRGENPYG